MNLAKHLPNVVEYAQPLKPGDRLSILALRVLEVRQLASTLTIGGTPRPLWVAVHDKRRDGSMLTLFVCLDGTQNEWSLA